MFLKNLVAWPSLAIILVAPLGVAVPSVAMAQGDCACILSPSASGALGAISEANGEIFVTGASGLVAGGVGSSISAGDVISTGATSRASLSFSGGCAIAMGPSSTVTISPAGENLCVRVIEDTLTVGDQGAGGGGDMTPALLAAGGAAGAALVVVGLGQSDSVSR
ncbi:hypothetical protein EMQ25_11625 [Arsenicitalea aurantiaca]|uniref:Uncharacterized protein n=1 Tax=Arsenicitalea aurantiaca TaxID=1783274 RepID=A0A433X7E8_9HYPH|nr:hypothetical protein [Arsenicitalea aurantiaca]RUT29982.1 hypothetical protein EMQ25_11625 [Arsenicitalea aurantiaca]